MLPPTPRTPTALAGYQLVFEDDFDGATLNETKWCRFYLPHWSQLERTRPSYQISESRLRLHIPQDHPQWSPEQDPGIRVSNLQTGHWSGPLGSPEGQHRFKPGFVVRDQVAPVKLFVPQYGRIEMRARAQLDAHTLAALWLIGYEDRPEHSGEITLMEIFGTGVSDEGVAVGRGIKKINDPVLTQEFWDDVQPIRLEDWHHYAIDWRPDGVDFLLDGQVISRSRQSPDYPMQLMLNLYHLGDPDLATDAWFDIDYIRGYRADNR
jgi:hypothetical protein